MTKTLEILRELHTSGRDLKQFSIETKQFKHHWATLFTFVRSSSDVEESVSNYSVRPSVQRVVYVLLRRVQIVWAF